MTKYIDAFRSQFGVEPICRTLAIAPSSYYAARTRPLSARAIRDAELRERITTAHRAHFGVVRCPQAVAAAAARGLRRRA